MASPTPLKALLFDVFGTCVDWRKTVTNTLIAQAHESLNSASASLATSVRLRATDMTESDWGAFAQQWRHSYHVFTRSIAADPSIRFKTVDEHHLEALHELVEQWGLKGLWTGEELGDLSLVWHRLDPWADTASGIDSFNNRFQTVTLSNGNLSLLQDLKTHGSLAFTHLFSAEMFDSYKPSPKVYLGAVERLGLEPRECAMVAAHLGDLKAAKSHGLQAIYVERAGEEGWAHEDVQKARDEGWVDIWIALDQPGFIAVAEKLGIETGLLDG
ncbi:haloacid dehalogenase [Aaosphaeria arxii CBS 175.79]|uniref:Haloacid dehalogenase n=1 Tax=Aaosphaeria arxii CBS 175.79 TaxID=1450172 RepID=A0A6A5XH38_9PLEO|nr:haloacid dehalogenase [Aaosphaeria arxii CBS 175.79]KAF2012402.1 haloacid dehalogenase [Aaosphaeria arxii CBS 175.79]